MAIANSGPLWRRIFFVLLIGTSASYYYYARREFTHGGSDFGLAYGIAGTVLILLLAFFGIRKRWYRSSFGTLEQWMQSHIYLGVLAMVILLFHTGGRFNDKIAVATLVLVMIVVASGIVGAILYVTVPRLLTEVESNLTVEEIAEQLNQLARSMARIASARSAPFQRIYDELLRQTAPGGLAGWRLIFSRLRRKTQQDPGDWARLIGLVPREEQEELRQMLVVSRQRRELLLRLVYQQRYKNVLEFWLYIHIPFTIALLAFAALHIAAVFYYGRMPW
jgi:predicted membrane channel-forming protein YqfA (hemolysin III family)